MVLLTNSRDKQSPLPMGMFSTSNSSQPKYIKQLDDWLRRGTLEVFTVNTFLTPDIANALLARNPDNRPLSMKNSNRSVAGYAEAMRRGEWALNGETIIVARDGFLNDGQNRCMACVEADVAVPVLITFGVERDTRHTVDQGIARTPGHILAMAREVNVNALAGALQFLWAHDAGVTLHARPSGDQMLDTLQDHPDVRDAINQVRPLCVNYRLSHGYLAAAHYLCSVFAPQRAQDYTEAVTKGLNIHSVNSPVARLRKQFEEHSAKRKRLDRIEQAALYIKGFNMFARGKSGAVVWRDTGPTAEAFPTVGG